MADLCLSFDESVALADVLQWECPGWGGPDCGMERVKLCLHSGGYVRSARANAVFTASSFMYSALGLYVALSCDTLDRLHPELAGWWFWESVLLVALGPISYWNDVWSFGLNRQASVAERLVDVSMLAIQASALGLLTLDLRQRAALAAMLALSAWVFRAATGELSCLLAAAGEYGAFLEKHTQGTITDGGMGSVGIDGVNSGGELISSGSHQAPDKWAATSMDSTDTNDAPVPCADQDQASRLKATLDEHYGCYIWWHTAWHFTLPLLGFLFVACCNWRHSAPEVPGLHA